MGQNRQGMDLPEIHKEIINTDKMAVSLIDCHFVLINLISGS